MVLGAALASTISLFLWSLSPSNETVMIPREMSSLPVLLDLSESHLGQLTKGGGSRGGGGGGGEGGRCVCGRESSSVLESRLSRSMDWNGYSSFQITQPSSLHSLDVILPSPCVVTLPSLHIRHPVLDKSMQQHAEQTMDRAKRMRKALVVAVTIDGTQFEWAKSAYATWGRDTSHLVFYVNSSSNISVQETRDLGFQVVKLPTSTNVHTRLALLQHLGEHHMKSHQWFMVVTEDTYVHMDQLEAVLGRLSPEDPLILGIPPHCQLRSRGSASSMVMNQALLALLTQQLHLCRNERMEVADSLGSAEMDACIGRHLNIHCSISSLVSAEYVEPWFFSSPPPPFFPFIVTTNLESNF